MLFQTKFNKMSQNTLQSKRFVLRQSLVGQNTNVEVTFKNGNTVTYSHDKAFAIMKDKLESLACFQKYKSYTASNNIPVVLRGTDCIVE
jgi:maltooligosyltrehalose synthase